jgi:hypothetical protein
MVSVGFMVERKVMNVVKVHKRAVACVALNYSGIFLLLRRCVGVRLGSFIL